MWVAGSFMILWRAWFAVAGFVVLLFNKMFYWISNDKLLLYTPGGILYYNNPPVWISAKHLLDLISPTVFPPTCHPELENVPNSAWEIILRNKAPSSRNKGWEGENENSNFALYVDVTNTPFIVYLKCSNMASSFCLYCLMVLLHPVVPDVSEVHTGNWFLNIVLWNIKMV